jgi:Asp-tRNA(Asn)/Glu-tRNA(Gln) amidotransferase A subunit family amidase
MSASSSNALAAEAMPYLNNPTIVKPNIKASTVGKTAGSQLFENLPPEPFDDVYMETVYV